jgi:lysophospholipase L1-like esterase
LIQGDASPIAEVRLLALGDSYTIGEAVAVEARWPMRLVAMMRARGVAVAEPTIVATTGWTTDELSRGIESANPQGSFDVVTLLIGVNNQYRGRSRDEYRDQFRSLLARAVALAGGRTGRVLVLSIPDWGVTPFAAGRDRAQIAAEIDAFNAINRDEARRARARSVDVTPISRRAEFEPGLIAADGLHPSGAMYAAWAAEVLTVVDVILRERSEQDDLS